MSVLSLASSTGPTCSKFGVGGWVGGWGWGGVGWLLCRTGAVWVALCILGRETMSLCGAH